jgi:hypothetical protein
MAVTIVVVSFVDDEFYDVLVLHRGCDHPVAMPTAAPATIRDLTRWQDRRVDRMVTSSRQNKDRFLAARTAWRNGRWP